METNTVPARDRELLELAAKAAGFIEFTWNTEPRARAANGVAGMWNPLSHQEQAEALRLKLNIIAGFDDRWKALGPCAYATYETGPDSCNSVMQNISEVGSKKAARRRAIVRAAAEIGRVMP